MSLVSMTLRLNLLVNNKIANSLSNREEISRASGFMYPQNNSTTSNSSLNFINDEKCNHRGLESPEKIAFMLFLILMLLACVVGNGLVILATALSKHLRSRVTILFIVSLACSDVIFGVFFIPFLMSRELNNSQYCLGPFFCYVIHIVDMTCNVASMINLLLIAVDRFVAIKFPFRYLHLLKYKRAKLMVAFVWLFSILWGFCGILKWSWKSNDPTFAIIIGEYRCYTTNLIFYATTYYAIYAPSLIAMSFFYIVILHVAIRQIRMIEATSVTLTVQSNPMSPTRSLNEQRESLDSLTDFTDINRNNDAKKKSRIRKRKRELKATKSVAIVYFAYFICWFPNLVINRIISEDVNILMEFSQRHKALYEFVIYFFVYILPIVNIMLNPIIYSFSNKQFRKAFKSVAAKLFGKYHSSNDYFAPSIRRNTRGISLAGVTSTTVTASASDFSVTSAANPVTVGGCSNNNEYKKKESKVSFGGVSTNETTIIWKPD